MAVRASGPEHPAKVGSLASPRLYVINFETDHPDHNTTILDRQHAIRRRRLVRRLHQAAAAVLWATGAAALIMLVLAGMAGLR